MTSTFELKPIEHGEWSLQLITLCDLEEENLYEGSFLDMMKAEIHKALKVVGESDFADWRDYKDWDGFFRSVKVLDVEHYFSLINGSKKVVDFIVNNFNNLTSLSLWLVLKKTDMGLEQLSRLRGINDLSICWHTDLEERDFEYIRNMGVRNLQVVWLDNYFEKKDIALINGLGLNSISFHPHPEHKISEHSFKLVNAIEVEEVHLNFEGSSINSENFARLNDVTRMVSLDLSSRRMIGGYRDIFKYLSANEPTLRHLNLSGSNVTDDDLKGLATFHALEEVDLSFTSLKNGEGVIHLANSPVKKLSLQCTSVNDTGLRNLCRIRTLECLQLGECENFTFLGLTHLRSLPNLNELDLKSSELAVYPGQEDKMLADPLMSVFKIDYTNTRLFSERINSEDIASYLEKPDLKVHPKYLYTSRKKLKNGSTFKLKPIVHGEWSLQLIKPRDLEKENLYEGSFLDMMKAEIHKALKVAGESDFADWHDYKDWDVFFRNVKVLDVRHYSSLINGSKKVVDFIVNNFHNLTSLSLWLVSKKMDMGLEQLSRLRGINNLSICWHTDLEESDFEYIRNMGVRNLQVVWLDNYFEEKDIALINGLGLNSISFHPHSEHKISEHSFRLENAIKVEEVHLNFEGSSIRNENFVHLKDVTRMVSLDISSRYIIGGYRSIFKYLSANEPTLRHLNLSGSNVTDDDLKGLSTFHALEEVDLSFTSLKNGEGVTHLSNSPVKKLSLKCTSVNDIGLRNLCRIRTLEYLHLGKCKNFTFLGLNHLRSLPNLNALDLTFSEIAVYPGQEDKMLADPLMSVFKIDYTNTHLSKRINGEDIASYLEKPDLKVHPKYLYTSRRRLKNGSN